MEIQWCNGLHSTKSMLSSQTQPLAARQFNNKGRRDEEAKKATRCNLGRRGDGQWVVAVAVALGRQLAAVQGAFGDGGRGLAATKAEVPVQ